MSSEDLVSVGSGQNGHDTHQTHRSERSASPSRSPEAPQRAPRPYQPNLRPLARTIECEIIPRLMLLHRSAPENSNLVVVSRPPEAGHLGPERLADFLETVLDQSFAASIGFVDRVLGEGHSVETVILDLCAPAARALGRAWEEDRLSFVEVTIALSRLQQVLRVYAATLDPDLDPMMPRHRLLLAAVPGETHTFGLYVVEAFFRREGWLTRVETRAEPGELAMLVAEHWFDVVGLTLSCDGLREGAGELIENLRLASKNPGLRVLLGGSLFAADPQGAIAMGADIEACAVPELVAAVNRMVMPARSA